MIQKTITVSRGFTVAEIIAVIGIIGILVSVSYAALSPARAKARDTQRVSDIGQLQIAFKLYRETYGEYPQHNQPVVIGEGGSLDTTLDTYIARPLTDPLGSGSDSTYEYVYDETPNCSNAGNRPVVYAKTMELESYGNWAEVCGGTAPGQYTYVVVLR